LSLCGANALDEVSANYIKAKSEELQKIPTKIVADLILEKIASENAVGVGN